MTNYAKERKDLRYEYVTNTAVCIKTLYHSSIKWSINKTAVTLHEL